MKAQLLAVFSLLSLFLCPANADDQFSDVPLTGDDLKLILELNVAKVNIDFEKPGKATLKMVSAGGQEQTFSINTPSNSAVLMTRVERGDDGLGKLYFWISSGRQTLHSSISFETEKAVHTRSGMVDGVYTIIARATKDDSSEVGYSIRVLSTE